MKVEADTVHIKVKCKPKNGEKATPSTSAAPAAPAAAPAKRKASEKQLEHLAKARAARAAKKAAEGGKPAEPKASTSKAAEKPKEKPKEEPKKETTFDFDELRARAKAQADKVITIKMLQTIYLGVGTFAQINKRNREEAAVIISRVLTSLNITKKKGVFISDGHALTEKQGELLVKAIGVVLRQKYLDSKEAKEDEKDERSKDRPSQIGNTLITFHTDDASMKELFKLIQTK